MVAKGEDPLADLDALDARHDAEPEDKDPNQDAMLRETGNVLLDYIGLTQQIAMLESPVDPIVR